MTHFLKPITIDQILNHLPKGDGEGEASRALGQSAIRLRNSPPLWQLVTPLTSENQPLDQSRFFRSITDHVDDASKKSNFMVMLTALQYAALQQNLPDHLRQSAAYKEAGRFKYQGSSLSIYEIKGGKKDRIYLHPKTIINKSGGIRCLILYLAHHKKDQKTPDSVKNYCSDSIKECYDNQQVVKILKG